MDGEVDCKDTLNGRQIVHHQHLDDQWGGLTVANPPPDQKLPLSAEPKPRCTHVPPALWPSPVRSSSANTSNAITPLRPS
ncbi:hypothetical protein E5288_WYG006732 [Bos mutus]|uniref:Uncharacterized protein n=1 Tax=Bos mutus TaxID=72004 RepID=A0A6B0REY6_9CETA|nr:hypothetical protein [Bos mutus]